MLKNSFSELLLQNFRVKCASFCIFLRPLRPTPSCSTGYRGADEMTDGQNCLKIEFVTPNDKLVRDDVKILVVLGGAHHKVEDPPGNCGQNNFLKRPLIWKNNSSDPKWIFFSIIPPKLLGLHKVNWTAYL